MTKVAIFETDHAFAVELRTELSRFGCTVQVFTDGTSGLTAAKSAPPDLILVSAELPPVNGFSTCNKIKKDDRLSSVPIILMSSQSSAETFEQHRRLPSRADDYVHKPISVADFLPHIRRLIELDDAGLVDEETSLSEDDDVLIVEDSVFDDVSVDVPVDIAPSRPGERRPTLELEIGDEPMTDRRPLTPHSDFDENESMEEDLETVVGERPHIPEHLLEKYRIATGGKTLVADGPGHTLVDESSASSPPASSPAGTPLPPASGPSVTPPPASVGTPAPISVGRSTPLPPLTQPTGPPPPGSGAWSSAPPMHAASVDVTRAKNALQSALSQLSQSRKEVAALRQKIAGAQSHTAEVQRLRKGLEQSQGAERETLKLREQLHARDKELVSARELMAAKEREVLATRDGTLAAERSLADLRERHAKVETERNASNARVGALRADGALSEKRAEDFKTGARKIAEQLNQRAKELAEAQHAHAAAVERMKREHQVALEHAEEKRRAELTDVENAHREQLARVKDAHSAKSSKSDVSNKTKIETAQKLATEQVARAKKAADEKVKRISSAAKADADKALKAADEKLERARARVKTQADKALQGAVKEAVKAADKQLQTEAAAYRKETAQLTRQLEAATREAQDLRALSQQAKEMIDASVLEREQLQEQLATLSETQNKQRAALEQHDADTSNLQKRHEKMLAKLTADHTDALKQAAEDARAAQHERETSFAAAKKKGDAALATAKKKIGDLQAAGTAQQAEAASLTATCAKLEARVKQVDPVAAELASVRLKLDKARMRWGEDRAELKRLKNTLAGLVRNLDETIVKDLEEPNDGER